MDQLHEETHEKLAAEILGFFPAFKNAMHKWIENYDGDLTATQLRVMAILADNPMTSSDLARARDISLQTASELITNLEAQGLVERVRNPEDKRKWTIKVTPLGKEKHLYARGQLIEVIAAYLEHLTPEEQAAVELALPALRRVFTENR